MLFARQFGRLFLRLFLRALIIECAMAALNIYLGREA
jgi:hypothetical protein